jgi:hypothetical protein
MTKNNREINYLNRIGKFDRSQGDICKPCVPKEKIAD